MASYDKFKLYDTDGLSLLYTFPGALTTNAPQSTEEAIEVTNVRSKGSLFIDGGTKAWNLNIRFILTAVDYEALTVVMDALESAVAFNTPYYIRFYKTSTTYYSYKVKRVLPIDYDPGQRVSFQRGNLIFKVNSW